jgi:Tfp pilus assembly protein PilF
VKALAEGYGGKIKAAIEKAIKLQPKHAHAHLAMGAYHAEVVDKIGGIAAKLTYGASKDNSEKHFKEALKLAPNLPIAQIEYANALMLLQGDKGEAKATELYVAASEFTARDAMERLDVEMAKASLE